MGSNVKLYAPNELTVLPLEHIVEKRFLLFSLLHLTAMVNQDCFKEIHPIMDVTEGGK